MESKKVKPREAESRMAVVMVSDALEYGTHYTTYVHTSNSHLAQPEHVQSLSIKYLKIKKVNM